MRRELEVRRGRVEPIGVNVEVSGSRDGTVSTSISTTLELDGRVVQFASAVPCRSGDELWVAGYWHSSGVFRALAYQLPRQGVLVGVTSRWGWWIGAGLWAIGCALFAVMVMAIAFYRMDPSADWSQLPLIMLFGSAFTLGGRAAMRSSAVSLRAREMLRIGSAVSGQTKANIPSSTSWVRPPSVSRR